MPLSGASWVCCSYKPKHEAAAGGQVSDRLTPTRPSIRLARSRGLFRRRRHRPTEPTGISRIPAESHNGEKWPLALEIRGKSEAKNSFSAKQRPPAPRPPRRKSGGCGRNRAGQVADPATMQVEWPAIRRGGGSFIYRAPARFPPDDRLLLARHSARLFSRRLPRGRVEHALHARAGIYVPHAVMAAKAWPPPVAEAAPISHADLGGARHGRGYSRRPAGTAFFPGHDPTGVTSSTS
jgi:hypothetical protein